MAQIKGTHSGDAMTQANTSFDRPNRLTGSVRRVCIVGASGKLGQYMVQHALRRGWEVVGVCREQSVGKLARFADRITIVPGPTNDADVIRRAVGRMRWGAGGARPLGRQPAVRVRHRPGGPQPRGAGRTPDLLVWLAHHP
jgi:NAD(P)-dependent dehydrogenase (short-subunit alcohol dehydrogenase family)